MYSVRSGEFSLGQASETTALLYTSAEMHFDHLKVFCKLK